MLEVKNLSKIYKSKKGVDVKALDNVTLSFPETGMVFLLGKSGSGKSTLLNVCGGLDAPTDGEIIVKGRSSKSFSQGDFDSYRNTFIGFIFQEYNILNEFTVEDNIALALELQNKRKDKAAIAKLLEDVDLVGYGNRKPNTLSGGQKQRIAIARALIKSPEIIMADEPSGALDSATGKQVFETLKKLSADKLVIVVSHDRDFAEQYGDRIIELKDGKVISDVSKVEEKQVSLTKNIHSSGNVLCIKQGTSLDDSDFAEIKKFLSNAKDDVIITSGEKEVKEFKKANRITEDGDREVFKEISYTNNKTYTPADSKFIRSRLPLRHAIKIGLSGMKSKPIRLAFTILLCIISFTMLGLLSTLSLYKTEPTFKESIKSSNQRIWQIQKEYLNTINYYEEGKLIDTYTSTDRAFLSANDITELKKIFGKNTFGAWPAKSSISVSTQSAYWSPEITSLGFMTEDNPLYQTIKGKYPKNADEICLSSYTAAALVNCMLIDKNGKNIKLKSVDDLIGKELSIDHRPYKVTGIFDSGEIPQEFEALNETPTDQEAYDNLLYKYTEYLSESLHLFAFTTEEAIKTLSGNSGIGIEMRNPDLIYKIANNGDAGTSIEQYSPCLGISKLPEKITVAGINSDSPSLKDNEVIVFRDTYLDALARIFESMSNDEAYNDSDTNFSELMSLCYEYYDGGVHTYDPDSDKDIFTEFTDAEKKDILDKIMKAVKKYNINLTVNTIGTDDGITFNTFNELEIVGYWFEKEDSADDMYEYPIYITDSLFNKLIAEHKANSIFYDEYTTKYVPDKNAFYDSVYVTYDKSDAQTNALWELYSNEKFDANDTKLTLSGSFVFNLQTVDEMVDALSQVFMWVGIIFAIFAALLFSNLISVSISQKKKEIGILRAVGAKGSDVFKIFFSESAFIASICVIISVILCVFICSLINKEVYDVIGAALFVFGIISLLLLIAVAVVTALIATFLPVFNAARKKPIDSIRSV